MDFIDYLYLPVQVLLIRLKALKLYALTVPTLKLLF